MVIGTMETEHFEFIVLGNDTTHATNLMNQAFAKHLTEMEIEWKENSDPVDWYGANFIEINIGDQLRDGESLR